ncbi:hypothetical protein ACIQZG_15945 [Lysinibacillus sp. NPDC096418]|uniref:hypothetical protein n=1 Tax=Lysinibacillus sp. NPDC096418 TaxID=3364138 RepID=UPI0037F8AB55
MLNRTDNLYHWVDKGKCMHREDGKVLVASSNGYLALNQNQYELLNLFDNSPRAINEVIDSYPLKVRNSISLFIELLIKKKILIESTKKYKLSVFGYIKKVIFIPLPHSLLNNIVNYLIKYINIKIVTVIGILINVLGLITILPLISLTEFNLASVPRNITTLLIGFLAAIFHEIWLAIYVHKSGMSIKKWYIRVIWGVVITLSINWSEMLLASRQKRITMFFFVINMTICTASIESILGLIFWYLDFRVIASYFCMFAVGTLIFLVLSLWPFLFKGDGYYLFQEVTSVYKIRPRFVQHVVLFYKKEQRNIWNGMEKKEKSILLLWGIIFTLTILTLNYLIYLGVRIII